MFFGPIRPVFWGQNKKIRKKFFWVFYGSNDLISTHMNGKRMPNSKSALQITPGGTKTRKMTYNVIKGY